MDIVKWILELAPACAGLPLSGFVLPGLREPRKKKDTQSTGGSGRCTDT